MKSHMLLWKEIAEESAIRCCTSATRDIKNVMGRVEHEGFSFMTITLPAFGKDFEKSLDQGQVDRNLFQGFAFTGGLPRLFGGFLDLVFDRTSGALLHDPSVDAILAVRQLTLMFSKLFLVSSEKRQRAAMDAFVQCEQDVREADLKLSESDKMDFLRMSRLLFRDLFSRIDRDIAYGELVPKHGPGATADKLMGNQKFMQRTWPERLDKVFPVVDYLLPNPSYYEELEQVNILEPGAETPVRVISVPKTQKTPRIIAIEPTAMQYAQQALLQCFLKHFYDSSSKRSDPFQEFRKSVIGFLDQTPNQEMAKIGSLTGILATLDLSEASDRVSNQHVRLLLSDHVHLHDAVDACRSRKADVPGHGVIRLAKYASMGSALTFPVEAFVFTTLVFLGIERGLNATFSRRDLLRLRHEVRVYGDDIIVPANTVQSVVSSLRTFGYVVNGSKSFWTGRFRESCGKEYYAGHDVSIVKVRQHFPVRRADATETISLVSTRNQLYWAGYWKTCKWLDGQLSGILKYYPVVEPSSSVLGRESVLPYQAERMHEHFQSPVVRGWVVSAVLPANKLDGWQALTKFFVTRKALPSLDTKHLERSGRPQSLKLKLRWSSPF